MLDTTQQKVVDNLELCVNSLMGVIGRGDCKEESAELACVIIKLKLTIDKVVEVQDVSD